MKCPFGEFPVRILAFGALLLALVLAFLAVQILLVPFVAALFVVYLFDPGVIALQRRGMDRGKAFLILLAVSLVAITVILMFTQSWLRFESIGGSTQTFAERLNSVLMCLERWVDGQILMF